MKRLVFVICIEGSLQDPRLIEAARCLGSVQAVAEAVRRCGYGARSMIISVGLRDLGEPGTMAN
jgi:hypothetical protein